MSRCVIPAETEVQRGFRAFCCAAMPLADACGLELAVVEARDGAVVAQVADVRAGGRALRCWFVHDDADAADCCTVCKSVLVFLAGYMVPVRMFNGEKKGVLQHEL